MADAPHPITSPPAQSWQPYNASAPGAAEDQIAPTTIYDAVGGDSAGGPWRKIQEAGACGPQGEAVAGSWPGNGTSDGSGWKQV
jgi:hypothetical protein